MDGNSQIFSNIEKWLNLQSTMNFTITKHPET